MLLFDNSAWARLSRLEEGRSREIAEWIEDGDLAVCAPFLLEAGYSARSGADHAAVMAQLEALPRVELDAESEALALRSQRELAATGHHRMPPSDLLTAACAARAGAGVLHYDRDYDILAACTSLGFESVWLAPAGTL